MERAACRTYEAESWREVGGDTIRPGGLELTARALAFCSLPKTARILDVGCGRGATLWYLQENFDKIFGVDVSTHLLRQAKKGNARVFQAVGEEIPIAGESMDAVLAECTLSLMSNIHTALRGIRRILTPGGRLIFSDLYARREEGLADIRKLDAAGCLGGIQTRQEICTALQAAGFTMLLWEDHSRALRQMSGQMILTGGSIQGFWDALPGGNSLDMQILISRAKPGYYLAVAGKG